MQDTFAWLAARGHDCTILAQRGATRAKVGGVMVWSQPTENETMQHFADCDVMLTQLDAVMQAQLIAAEENTPLIQMIHSASQLESLGVWESCSALVVYNSAWVSEACAWWPGESIVLHPPIDAERVRCEPNPVKVTLINMSHAKGANHFYRLAQELPHRGFLGVMGSYGEQAITPHGIPGYGDNPTPTPLPANMQVTGTLPEIRDAFGYTRVLLVLSIAESYGRVAAEACVSGIPTIAVRTAGLEEALGDAGHWVESRDDIRGIARLIEQAHDEDTHAAWSAAALARADRNAKRQEKELRAFERALKAIVKNPPEMRL